MPAANTIDRATSSFRRGAWAETYELLVAADNDASLALADIERLAVTAHLLGRDIACANAWVRAYHECLRADDLKRASRCAFWLSFGLFFRGEAARSSGWLARAERLLERDGEECPEQGYVKVLGAIQSLHHGEADAAHSVFADIVRIGERHDDPDLAAMGRLGIGQALLRMERRTEGFALLDEVMVAVTAEEVSPIVAGTVYCAVIEACQAVFEFERAQEWTAALTRWCDAHPDVIYHDTCLVHRAEIMQLRGAWPDAMEEVTRVRQHPSRPPSPQAAGAAHYQQAELHRVRGEFAQAEEAYRQANALGRLPQPGLALLRLAQGQIGDAAAAIRLALDQAGGVERTKLLPAYADVMLAEGDTAAARAAADELAGQAAAMDAPFLRASALHVSGAVLLAEGRAPEAMRTLRSAWRAWQELDAPYEGARVRVLVGRASRELGDEDTATMELDSARAVFQDLGAAHDVAIIDALSGKTSGKHHSILTARETEVLRLTATGKTNHEIGADLFLSDHTVRRHLQNIFAKLGVTSRAAATAYAIQHDLI